MRIAVWNNLPSGGGKRALYQQVRGLLERGHEIASWTLSTADRAYLPLDSLVREHVVPFVDAEPRGRGRVARLLGGSNTARRIARMHEACERCGREMRERGVDLVFAASCRFYGIPFIGLHSGLPTVAYVQEPNRVLYEAGHLGGEMLPWVAPPAGDGPRARLRRAVELEMAALGAREEWRAVHALDLLLVNSRFSRESFLRAYGVESRVCYLGIDTGLFRPLGLPRERYILGLGSFDSIKRVDLAVRSVALLPEPRPPLVWICNSGDPAYTASTVGLARHLGVELRIRTGVPDGEVVQLLNQASLLLYTSRLEPFGYAPLEANACGTPVVAVAEGGVRETVADGVNGLLAEPDPALLARAMSRLLGDTDALEAAGRRASEHVASEWSLEASMDRLEANLVQALGRSRRSP
ncbi:MAG TPA: glycosyltransferase family 4 protein [Longimicrobium sp.]|jgi:glycosyltransferase involved in cell wall biosynthesis|uniref:glycosyltransferase family 4 protein n=1 Tax=Longimicrobium sp. TaxID=2029185 RepID=UPI002EDADBD9